MKVLTAAQMREVDRKTIDAGIPGLILMENAAHAVVDFAAKRFSPLSRQHVLVLCGKGNNGGDGMAVARQIHARFAPRRLDVLLVANPQELEGDAAANYDMLRAAGVEVQSQIGDAMREATLVIDAVLGTGVKGPARDRAADMIAEINSGFPRAQVLAVDVPSGMASDSAENEGPCARADATVTFTAPKVCHALPPNCDRVGELIVAPIGSPATLFEGEPALCLSLLEPRWLAGLFAPRDRGAHKGSFGHVLVIAGSRNKPGAAAMTGVAALRAGAGLVTVAAPKSALSAISAHAPELMTEPLDETESGEIAPQWARLMSLAEKKTVVAIGPGLGTHADTVNFVREIYAKLPLPLIVDADGLNAMAGAEFRAAGPRVMTPHPGEMQRLCGTFPSKRVSVARSFALMSQATLVLKGQRTLIAHPDGQVWINPTGTPAMATGGSGDILTGLIAGLMAQFPARTEAAVASAVWVHGRAGELGAVRWGEKSLLATDLLPELPGAMRELANLPQPL